MTSVNRKDLIQYIRSWGGSSANACLDPKNSTFSIPSIDGVISYRDSKDLVVVFGHPLCQPSDTLALAQGFDHFCKQEAKDVIYIGVSESFARLAHQNMSYGVIETSQELFFDPFIDPQAYPGSHGSLVRRKVRHAQKEGVKIEEHQNNDTNAEKIISELANHWLNKKTSRLHISGIHLFEDREGKRWFYAIQGDAIVAVAVLNQLDLYQGWHLNHLMVSDKAAHGSAEFLIVSILEQLKNENCHYLSVGAVPAHKLGKFMNIHPLYRWVARPTFLVIKHLFKLDGIYKFWEKFHPQIRSSFILISHNKIPLRHLKGLFCALQTNSEN